MPIVTFLPSGRTQEVASGTTLFRAAKMAGLTVAAGCEEELICGKCNLEIRQGAGNLSALSARERRVLEGERCPAGDRLACGTKVRGDCTVRARYW